MRSLYDIFLRLVAFGGVMVYSDRRLGKNGHDTLRYSNESVR
jgi:hypothetical protein